MAFNPVAPGTCLNMTLNSKAVFNPVFTLITFVQLSSLGSDSPTWSRSTPPPPVLRLHPWKKHWCKFYFIGHSVLRVLKSVITRLTLISTSVIDSFIKCSQPPTPPPPPPPTHTHHSPAMWWLFLYFINGFFFKL